MNIVKQRLGTKVWRQIKKDQGEGLFAEDDFWACFAELPEVEGDGSSCFVFKKKKHEHWSERNIKLYNVANKSDLENVAFPAITLREE